MEKLHKKTDSNRDFARAQLLKFKVRGQMEFIQSQKKSGTSMISITVPPTRNSVQKAIELTKQKNVNSGNIKNRINRESVVACTSKLLVYLRALDNKEFEGTFGALLFVGVFGSHEEVCVISIPPLELIKQFTYSCDTAVELGYVEKMVQSKTSTLFCVTDGHGIVIWSQIQGVVAKEYEEDYFVVSKTRRGGQSSARFGRIADMNVHQQITNSTDVLIKTMRLKNREFDSMFVCGSEEHRKEVITAFKDSDMSGRAKVIRDIPISVKSTDLTTLGQLKEAIPNISEYLAEDSIYNEKIYQERLANFLSLETETIEFGIEGMLNAIAASNTALLVINESNKARVTAQMLQDFGINQAYIGDREDISLIELLLEYALDQNVELAIIQSTHIQSFLDPFGGLYTVLKF